MRRDSFDALIGLSGGPEIAVYQQINLRQIKLNQSIGAYANHQVAMPDVHVARRTDTFVPVIVGEDGSPMTPERRQELMKGKPTMLELSAQGADPMDVGHYDQLFTAKDIQQEELGLSAMANRPGFRQVDVRELELASELLARQGLPGETIDMSLCCYSAPYISTRKMLWSELAVACLKVRALSPANIGPEQVLVSPTIQQLLMGSWRKLDAHGRLMGLPVAVDPRLRNEIRICATSARPELSGRYACLFIDQGIYEDLEIDPDEIDVVFPQAKPD